MQLAFRGEHRIAAPRELVWRLLHDPETLRRCASGVEAIEVVDPWNWKVRVAVGIGPFQLRIPFEARLHDFAALESAEMRLDGEGAGTHISLRTTIHLEGPEPLLTILRWDATGGVSGAAAGLGRGLVEFTARTFTTDFWRRFADDAARIAARDTAERAVPPAPVATGPRRVLVDRGTSPIVADLRGEAHGVTPLLLLHGMWCDRRMFDSMAPELAQGGPVLVPDLRGHGESSQVRGWDLEDLAHDMVELLNSLRFPAADVIGFSLGGMAALQLALRWPERVRRLVLVSTTGSAEGPVRQAELRVLSGVLRRLDGETRLLDPVPQWVFAPDFRDQHPEVVSAWLAVVRRMSGESLAQALDVAAARPDLRARLADIAHPALVVVGARDALLPTEESRRLAEGLPGGRLVSLEGAGHALPLERPHELAALVREFVREPAGQPR
ncbi:MAG: alpha/beta fold hydrolase [Gemmatimonadales bacterium]